MLCSLDLVILSGKCPLATTDDAQQRFSSFSERRHSTTSILPLFSAEGLQAAAISGVRWPSSMDIVSRGRYRLYLGGLRVQLG